MTPACPSISWKCGACFLCVLWFVGVGFAGATSTLPKTFNVPANTADKSLKQFSEQAGLEVVFSTRVTREVVTKPVKGDMTGRQAPDAMLAGTGLIVIQDAKTGAFTYNYTDHWLVTDSPTPVLRIYQGELETVMLNFSYRIRRGATFSVDVTNVLGEGRSRYQSIPSQTRQIWAPNTTINFGLSGSF
jgi:hypothetical protein